MVCSWTSLLLDLLAEFGELRSSLHSPIQRAGLGHRCWWILIGQGNRVRNSANQGKSRNGSEARNQQNEHWPKIKTKRLCEKKVSLFHLPNLRARFAQDPEAREGWYGMLLSWGWNRLNRIEPQEQQTVFFYQYCSGSWGQSAEPPIGAASTLM